MPEFEEIAHSGGTVTLSAITDSEGRRAYQQSYSNSRPNQSAIIAVWALPQGVPVASVNLGGMGVDSDPAPIAGCYMVMIGSDSHGKFGHHCPSCDGYWRSGPWPRFCPYCRYQDQPFNFMSEAQLRYVEHYCHALTTALQNDSYESFLIDMDVVADAAGKDGEKPAFYVSEESQQHKFKCDECGEFNDVIGRFAYCSACATRNETAIFKTDVAEIRSRLSAMNKGNIVRDAVSAFDNIVGQFAKQFLRLVPLSKRRRERLERGRFVDIADAADTMKWFDIDILSGLSAAEITFVKRMFLRRHVYEHNGGEVDARYLEKSGDRTVRLKQHLTESLEDLHRLLGDLDRVVANMHSGFHELLPPLGSYQSPQGARGSNKGLRKINGRMTLHRSSPMGRFGS